MITRSGLADEIDGFDVQIKALNEAKSAAYKAYREQLEDAGMEPRRASAEVAATKAAIVKRRKLRENPDAAREKDDMIDAILVEIMERPSRAREASQSYAEQKGKGEVGIPTSKSTTSHDPKTGETVEDGQEPCDCSEHAKAGEYYHCPKCDAEWFPEETGEITEHKQPETATTIPASQLKEVTGGNLSIPSTDAGGEDRAADADHFYAQSEQAAQSVSNPQPTSSPEADKTGEAVPPPSVSPVALSDDDVPAFIKKDKDGCLNLKDGHCRIGFVTDALCSECNHARMARAV